MRFAPARIGLATSRWPDNHGFEVVADLGRTVGMPPSHCPGRPYLLQLVVRRSHSPPRRRRHGDHSPDPHPTGAAGLSADEASVAELREEQRRLSAEVERLERERGEDQADREPVGRL